MKKIILFLLCSITAQAQTELKKAVFKDCISEKAPVLCTYDKISAGMEQIVTSQNPKSLQSVTGNQFTVEYIIIIDKEGNIIPDETIVNCKALSIADKLKDYLNKLPTLSTTEESRKKNNGKTLYFNLLLFIYNDIDESYHNTDKETVKSLGLNFNFKDYGTEPFHEDCIGDKNVKECSANTMRRIVAEKFAPPVGIPEGKYKFIISFIVNEDGGIENVMSNDERFQKASEKVAKKIKGMRPATVKDIPIRARYNIPVTLNL